MNQQISPLIQNILKDKSLSLQQKLTTFMMYSDPKMLPDNPNAPDFSELGVTIKKLINDGKIKFGKMNSQGVVDIHHL